MGARIKSILAVAAGCLAFGLISGAAGSAYAGGGSCGCTPPPPPPCCEHKHHNNNNNNNFVSAMSQANANASGSANANTAVLVGTGGGGGGGGGFITSGPTSLLSNLNVVGAEAHRTSFEATRTKFKKVVIEAVCIDDKAIPHPASQVSPDRDIEDSFDGELYRCIAGTHMQATVAEYLGKVSFDHGQTIDCLKDQALYHFSGGKVECHAQKPARDCNERSLLRRFGAGVKILSMLTIEKYTETREEASQTSSGSMILDGGVGGVMY
jgi:hypothetical protein